MTQWKKDTNEYEFYEFPAEKGPDLVPKLMTFIEEQFGMRPTSFGMTLGVNEVSLGYESFFIDGDNWMGFSIVATSEEGNPVVRKAAAYIETLLEEGA